MGTLIEWDRELMVFLNNLGSIAWDPFWIFISEKWVWFPLYTLLLFLGYRKLPLNAFLWSLLAIALTVLATDQGSVQLFKEQFERLRPCHGKMLSQQLRIVDGCGGKFGFVSSHASNVFGITVFMGLLLHRKIPYLFPLLLIWAILVSYSRVYLGAHYPLDILGGAALGSFCGWGVYRLHQWVVSSKSSS